MTKLKQDVVRLSMLVLPAFLQGLITKTTGRALADEKYTSRSSVGLALRSLIILGLSTYASMMLFSNGMAYLLPFIYIITVSTMRNLQVVIYHHCSHDAVFKTPRLNTILGEFISMLLVIKNFSDYKDHHLAHHSPKHLLTLKDETATDLQDMRLTPGLPYPQLVRNLWLGLVSPFNHMRWNFVRIAQCFFSNHPWHNIISLVFWSATISLLYGHGLLTAFSFSYLLPLFTFYNICRVLRLVVEHCWPEKSSLENRDMAFVALSTKACFCGELAPELTDSRLKNFIYLTGFSLKLFLFHGVLRALILPGDTPNHDLHHRRPLADWANAETAREKDYQSGCEGFPYNYQHIWGIPMAIKHNLKTLSLVKSPEWI